MSDKTVLTLRAQAWARAKGELGAVLATYWPEWTGRNEKVPNGFEEMQARIQAFIEDVDGSI